MKSLLVVVALAACTNSPREHSPPAATREPTFDVAFVETIADAPVTHLAVGGTMHVRVPDQITNAYASGPIAVMTKGDGTLSIVSNGAGSGTIEIETVTGYARFTVTSAPVAKIDLLFDKVNPKRATIALLDANGKRLVDASLRIAPGSAPVAFLRGSWDRIEFETLPPGEVLVKTDLVPATRAELEPTTLSSQVAANDRGALDKRAKLLDRNRTR